MSQPVMLREIRNLAELDQLVPGQLVPENWLKWAIAMALQIQPYPVQLSIQVMGPNTLTPPLSRHDHGVYFPFSPPYSRLRVLADTRDMLDNIGWRPACDAVNATIPWEIEIALNAMSAWYKVTDYEEPFRFVIDNSVPPNQYRARTVHKMR